MVPGARARHVEQVSFCVVDLLKVGIVGYVLDPFLEGDDLIVTRHDRDSAELQSLGQMHGAYRDAITTRATSFVKDLKEESGVGYCSPSPVQLCCRPHEYAHLTGAHAFAAAVLQPLPDRVRLFLLCFEQTHGGVRAIEGRNRSSSVLDIPVDIRDNWTEQTVSLHPDLMRSAVVQLEKLRSPTNLNAHGLPGERRLEDALPQVACEEQAVSSLTSQRGQEAQLSDSDVLRFVHDHEVKQWVRAVPELLRE